MNQKCYTYGPLPVHNGKTKPPKGTFWVLKIPGAKQPLYWCDLLAQDDRDTVTYRVSEAAKFKTKEEAELAWQIRGRIPSTTPEIEPRRWG